MLGIVRHALCRVPDVLRDRLRLHVLHMLIEGFFALVVLRLLLLQSALAEALRKRILVLRHHDILLHGRLLAEHRRRCLLLLCRHLWRRNRPIISVNLLPLVLLYSRRLLRGCVGRGSGAADRSSRPTFFLILTISLDRIQLFLFDRHNLPPLIQAIRPGHSQSG